MSENQAEKERPKEFKVRSTNKLHLKFLPYGTQKDEVYELARRYGEITDYYVAGTNGFVTFLKPEEAKVAIYELGKISYKGSQLRAEFKLEKQERKSDDAETTTATPTTEVKPVENKGRFSQQQQIVKPKAKPQPPQQPQQQPQQKKTTGKA